MDIYLNFRVESCVAPGEGNELEQNINSQLRTVLALQTSPWNRLR